eukprot:scaffold21329_cov62-Phaeocystis_antarctica.AAC.1
MWDQLFCSIGDVHHCTLIRPDHRRKPWSVHADSTYSPYPRTHSSPHYAACTEAPGTPPCARNARVRCLPPPAPTGAPAAARAWGGRLPELYDERERGCPGIWHRVCAGRLGAPSLGLRQPLRSQLSLGRLGLGSAAADRSPGSPQAQDAEPQSPAAEQRARAHARRSGRAQGRTAAAGELRGRGDLGDVVGREERHVGVPLRHGLDVLGDLPHLVAAREAAVAVAVDDALGHAVVDHLDLHAELRGRLVGGLDANVPVTRRALVGVVLVALGHARRVGARVLQRAGEAVVRGVPGHVAQADALVALDVSGQHGARLMLEEDRTDGAGRHVDAHLQRLERRRDRHEEELHRAAAHEAVATVGARRDDRARLDLRILELHRQRELGGRDEDHPRAAARRRRRRLLGLGRNVVGDVPHVGPAQVARAERQGVALGAEHAVQQCTHGHRELHIDVGVARVRRGDRVAAPLAEGHAARAHLLPGERAGIEEPVPEREPRRASRTTPAAAGPPGRRSRPCSWSPPWRARRASRRVLSPPRPPPRRRSAPARPPACRRRSGQRGRPPRPPSRRSHPSAAARVAARAPEGGRALHQLLAARAAVARAQEVADDAVARGRAHQVTRELVDDVLGEVEVVVEDAAARELEGQHVEGAELHREVMVLACADARLHHVTVGHVPRQQRVLQVEVAGHLAHAP